MELLSNQRVLAFVPEFNSEGKKDVTGAFMPEAKKFIAMAQHGSKICTFNNRRNLQRRRDEVMRVLRYDEDYYSSIAFFCHGWMDGIQAGFQRRHVDLLAQLIGARSNDDELVVMLYCCSTGQDPQDDPLTAVGTGDDSFADKLRDALCVAGYANCRVVAHTTVGDTTRNPHVLFMDGMGVPTGGVGGYPPVSPKSAHWATWKKKLKTTDLRFRMGYMSPAEIHEHLVIK